MIFSPRRPETNVGWNVVVFHISRQWQKQKHWHYENSMYLCLPYCSCAWHWTLPSKWCPQRRLSPPVAPAVSVCTCRWQMWWRRRAGKRPVTNTSASMTAGPLTSAMPRAACRQTPEDSLGGSRNWPTMWVVRGSETLDVNILWTL